MPSSTGIEAQSMRGEGGRGGGVVEKAKMGVVCASHTAHERVIIVILSVCLFACHTLILEIIDN